MENNIFESVRITLYQFAIQNKMSYSNIAKSLNIPTCILKAFMGKHRADATLIFQILYFLAENELLESQLKNFRKPRTKFFSKKQKS